MIFQNSNQVLNNMMIKPFPQINFYAVLKAHCPSCKKDYITTPHKKLVNYGYCDECLEKAIK